MNVNLYLVSTIGEPGYPNPTQQTPSELARAKAEFHQLWGSAEFLLQRGYHVSVDGRRWSDRWKRGMELKLFSWRAGSERQYIIKNEEIQEAQTNMLFANFLLQLILCFSYSARISVKDADWLRQRIVEVGGLQMLATLETGDRT